MPQVFHQMVNPNATFANNKGVNSGASETIILDNIPCLGLKNIGVTITAYSGSISAVALYGSDDGINYTAISGLSSFTVAASNTGHKEVQTVFTFLRLTTTGTALIDAYLNAVV